MIRIENISFDFTVPDERFAQELYADWDGFCQRCFERVVEECLAPYGNYKEIIELDLPELDLGSISENEFYDEFPERLKEALMNALPSWFIIKARKDIQNDVRLRIKNLLFFLEHGYMLYDVAENDFNLTEETQQLAAMSSDSYSSFIKEVAILCLRREYALIRLAEQTDCEDMLLNLFDTALAEPSAGHSEKQRLLVRLQEIQPEIPVRFIHESDDSARLYNLSGLLDSLSVRQLIRTETKEHAEVDLPPYWHYIYVWLIEYYPYNGIAMFGSKTEFTRHLNHKLLTFIHKRNGASYLSKAELTVSFLQEVFGTAYYNSVLNSIYFFQPHNPDGSPVNNHNLNYELYRMFMKLSLLQLPDNNADVIPSHVTLRHSIDSMMEKYQDELIDWLEKETNEDNIVQMAKTADYTHIKYLTEYLARSTGFEYPDAFRHLMEWLSTRIPAAQFAVALFSFIREKDWRKFSPQQIEEFFFSRLYGKTEPMPAIESLADRNMTGSMRIRLFKRFLHHSPEKLLTFLKDTVTRNIMSQDEWMSVSDTSDWLFLAASVSLAKAELLKQITDSLSLPENERKKNLAAYIMFSDTVNWTYDSPGKTVRDFINVSPSLQISETSRKKVIIKQIEKKLLLKETATVLTELSHDSFWVGNAGLCILAPWFIKLFGLLGYLDEERKDFRDIASKVRAVFLLQYLAYGKEKTWCETELVFNRMLTALPEYVPLPKLVELTDEEIQTADSMVAGVKANWKQMDGTSVEGFRGSFIMRRGRLVMEEERWVLTVDEKAYDILLETVPWNFRHIYLPWIKKHVLVKWQEKQSF